MREQLFQHLLINLLTDPLQSLLPAFYLDLDIFLGILDKTHDLQAGSKIFSFTCVGIIDFSAATVLPSAIYNPKMNVLSRW